MNANGKLVLSPEEDEARRCYELLECEFGASLEEVNRQLREKQKVYHPDTGSKKDKRMSAEVSSFFLS